MLSGYKLIRELGRNGLRGEFFSYEQYKRIVQIKKFKELKLYLTSCGFTGIESTNSEAEIVQALKDKQSKGYVAFSIAEVLFWIILGFGGCS